MRILPVALALSAAIHGAALAWAVRKPPPPLAIPPVPPRVAAVPVPVEVAPMAVALLDDRVVVPVLPSPGGEVGASRTRVAATTARAGGEIGAPAGETAAHDGHAGAGHSPLMTMRAPEWKGLSPAFIESFLSKPVVAQPNPIEGERVGDDIAAIEHDLHDPYWIEHSSPDQVMAARQKLVALFDARDGRELRRDGDGYRAEHQTFVAHVDPDGTAHIQDKPNWQQKSLFHAELDATDALMRARGDDPYASAKRKLLDDTREERYEIGKRYKHEQLGRSAVLAKETVDWLWAKTSDPRERKEDLFELWDDCAEAGDADLVEGGRAARGVIVGFIRAHLTGVDAFTPDELAALNARRHSTATFAPYAE